LLPHLAHAALRFVVFAVTTELLDLALHVCHALLPLAVRTAGARARAFVMFLLGRRSLRSRILAEAGTGHGKAGDNG
jgi:hypothetical protein